MPPEPLSRPRRTRVHRVKLEFDSGYGFSAELICPESGCTGSQVCGLCGRDVTDTESEPCYDCRDMDPAECWVKTWFDNCSADELMHGSLTVEIDPEWDLDHMKAHIVGRQAMPDAQPRQAEVERMRENAKVAMAESGRMMAAYGRAQTEANRLREALETIERRTSSDDLQGWQAVLICREALHEDPDA